MVPLAVSICSDGKQERITALLKALLKAVQSRTDIAWKPQVMIDDGAAEKSGVTAAGLYYLLCRFHFIKSWKEKLSTLNLSKKAIYGKIMGHLVALANARSEGNYVNNFLDFQQFMQQESSSRIKGVP